jgi:hypothetical protein
MPTDDHDDDERGAEASDDSLGIADAWDDGD